MDTVKGWGYFGGLKGPVPKLGHSPPSSVDLRVSGPLLPTPPPFLCAFMMWTKDIHLYGSYMFRLDMTRVKKWRMFWKKKVVPPVGF